MVEDRLKVAIVYGASKKNDAVRGIGAYNSELFKALRNVLGNNIVEVNTNDDLSEYDVVHFTVFRPLFISLPFTKPKNTKFTLTIHDMHQLIYPGHFPPGIKGTIKFWINKLFLKLYVDQIIAVSETSKADICRFLGVKPEKVNVVYHGVKDAYHPLQKGKWVDKIKSTYNLPNRFAFYLGDVNYNKNIPTLVEACQKANTALVMAGKQIAELDKIDMNHPENVHLKNVDFSKVIRVGFISDEEANQMMNLAVCTIQPSFYEGFGLSIIHAFASGCPVIASKTQALVETSGEAALYFNPLKVDELVEKIKMLVEDEKLRQKYIKKGFERVKIFNWQKTAEETLAVYTKV